MMSSPAEFKWSGSSFKREGNIAAEFDVHCLGKGISPYPFILCLPQDEHEAILVRHLKAAGVEVEWQTELSEMNDIGIRVQAHTAA